MTLYDEQKARCLELYGADVEFPSDEQITAAIRKHVLSFPTPLERKMEFLWQSQVMWFRKFTHPSQTRYQMQGEDAEEIWKACEQ